MLFWRFTILALVGLLGVMPSALAVEKQLPMGFKTDRELGNAFMDTWHLLRTHFDSLASSGGHPSLLEKWCAGMPEFLLRDVAQIATQPAVVLAAALRLAQIGGARNRAIIEKLHRAQGDSPLGVRLYLLSIRFGDRAMSRDLISALKSSWSRERLRAAILLAEAGLEPGKRHLKDIARRGGAGFDQAVRTLGRVCRRPEEAFLEELETKYPGHPAVKAARGELAMRVLFPFHHQMLQRRNPTFSPHSPASDIYDAWFAVVGELAQQGVRSSVEFVRLVEMRQRSLSSGEEGELWYRWLQTLLDFWREVDEQVARPDEPRWPRDLESARAIVQSSPAETGEGPGDVVRPEDRISAAIALLRMLDKAVGHRQLTSRTVLLDVLTPGGDRAVDGNPSTAWHGMTGDGLTIKRGNSSPLRSIWVMASCPNQPHRGFEALEIQDSEGNWAIQPRLDPDNRYFQQIELPSTKSTQLTIRVLATRGELPGCLAEIRGK